MPSHSPEDISAEFYIDGEYRDTYAGVDLTARVRGEDRIRITRGQADQQSSVSPASANLTLNNGDGLFTNENPNSPLWGKVPLQMRARVGVKDSAGTWGEYLRMPDLNQTQTTQYAHTADKASLDTTDLDIRIEYTPYYTRPAFPMALMGKYLTTGNQRSWFLSYQTNGTITIRHSSDGTFGTVSEVNSGTVMSEENSGRRAVRVTLDVNNGSGGKTWRFYTADSIAGPWVEVSSLTTAGTTAIFASTQGLEIGSGNDGGGVFSGYTPFRGKIHAAEVCGSIGGSVVADFKPAGKGLDTRTWVDACASPNTWEMTGDNIRLASDRIRISGELSSIPENWDVTGNNRYVPATISGVLARYQSNKGPLRGAIYRNYRNYPGLTGYWTMEDEPGATQAGASIPGSLAGSIATATFGTPTGLPGSTGAITLSSAPNVSKAVLTPKVVSNTGTATFLFYFRLDALPGSDQTLVTLLTNGTVQRWTIAVSGSGFAFTGYDSHNQVVDTGGSLFGSGASPLDQWIGMQFTLAQEGGNVRWTTAWHAVGTDIFFSHFGGGDTFAGIMRPIRRVTLETSDAAFAGAQFAHVMTATTSDLDLVTDRFKKASNAYDGETFGGRAIRLSEEEDVFFEWLGDPDETEIVGPQPADTLFNILSQGATVDGGILADVRDRPGYFYVSARALGSRRGLALNYSESHFAATPAPTNDNRYTVNDFTATRPAGSSARYEATDDRIKNVRDPDNPDSPGIGRWERTGAFNVSTDGQLPGQAERQVALGTWPERRIPNLHIDPHRSEIFSDPALLADVIALNVGDPATLIGLEGTPMPPDDRHLLTLGYTEVINNFLWELAANTVPALPYWVPTLGSEDHEPRLDSSVTEVHCDQDGIAAAATEVRIRTPRLTSEGTTEPAWIDSTNFAAEFPVDITIAGERMTLTASTVADGNMELVAGHFENADFTTYWLANGGSVTQSSVFAQAGTYSALLTVSGSPTQAYIYPDTATAAPRVNPGDSITASGWVRVAVNQTDVRMVVDWLDSDSGYLSSSDSGAAALTAAAGWVQRTVTATAPANAHYLHYHPMILSSPSNGTLLYQDNLAVTNNTWKYQTLTVTRSVNGVEKTLQDGDKPYLFDPSYFGFGEAIG